MTRIKIDPFLAQVSKPARYLGNEVNSIHKDIDKAEIKIAFAFPDVYEVGMSHLGLKILYQIVNDLDWAVAERVYAPWFDLEEVLRRENIPLFSLESRLPLSEFELIGFSLQYEMSYTNVLNMLNLSQIPLLSYQRTDKDPLIIAGGPCSLNPEPMADFIDLFCLGDGEELLVEILQTYRANKGRPKEEILEALSRIEGVYVPAFYAVSYQADLTIKDILPQRDYLPRQVHRRVIQNLDQAKFPTRQIVPFMEIVHDRSSLEIQRGCTKGCRFCHAGMVYRPLRQRRLSTLIQQAQEVNSQTGYEEIALCSLSSTDYPSILKLVSTLDNCFAGQTAISLPSLRVDPLIPEITKLISKISQTSLTLAPEAASQRLQQVINKHISEEELIAACQTAYQLGWNSVKLYFMIGLPTEKEEDLDALIELISKLKRMISGKRQIKVSISSFVPKPHTPFQWEAQVSRQELKIRQEYIRNKLPRKGVAFGWHDVNLSFLEGVFARGDRRLSKVLLRAFELGCKFDGWSDYFRFDLWLEAFAQSQISPEFYANRLRSRDEILPWEHINVGLSKEFLTQELQKAYQGLFTPDCQKEGCYNCGLKCKKQEGIEETINLPAPVPSKLQARIFRVRLKFTRGEEVKFISHLEMIRLFVRAIRRADIPVTMSEGFHPHMRISFGHPLAVGMKSQAEFIDFDLSWPMRLEDLQSKLNQTLPAGIRIMACSFISTSSKSLSAYANLLHYQAKINSDKGKEWWQERIEQLLASQEIWIRRVRPNNSKEIEIRKWVKDVRVSEGIIIDLWLRATEQGTVKPTEVISWLEPASEVVDLERLEQLAMDGKTSLG